MPELSRFLGIVITMFYNDHGQPHSKRALRLVLEWCRLHKDELLENWELAKQRKPLKRIAPLE